MEKNKIIRAKISGYREVPKIAQLNITEHINSNFICCHRHMNIFSEPVHRKYVQQSCKTMFEKVFCFANQSIMFLGNIENLTFS